MSRRLALYLLGPLKFKLNNAPIALDRRKALALLVYLTINHEQHTREYLSAMLWPEYDQEKAFTNLRHTLWETQQAIGDGWMIASRDKVGINTDADIWLDVNHFESLIKDSHTQTNVALRIPLLTDSVAIYRNHFLTGFSLKDAPHFNEWAFTESENLRGKLAAALTMLADDLCVVGQAEIAIPHVRRLIALDPLNEASHRQVMKIYIEAGQHTAALKQYHTCEQILRKELGVDPQPETRALYKQIRMGKITTTQFTKPKESIAPQHNLPFQLSKFIGREKELDEIKDLIVSHRLVTLTGTGGIGKTRLSLKMGEQLINTYANGIWFMELASLNDPALVPQTVAKLFQLVEQAGESLTEKLIRVLRPKNLLLILDNCEHLLDASAKLADALLRNCPNVKILATSREALGITGESQYHVPPLALPDIQQLLEQLLGYESIQLFEERARLVKDNFSLTLQNASSVARICSRLDGIPLAIELAAARVSLLSTEQIASRLDESFNLLTGGSRTAMPRHQTLRASIDWSWNLLSAPEQILLQRLSIFAGGWTLDAAEAVCAGNGIEPQQVVDGMTQLVAKSLVAVNQETGRERRYHLLEMVRQFVHEKLVEAGEEDRIQDQHLKYFLSLSEQVESGLGGQQQFEWFSRTNAEYNNLHNALEYAAKIDVEAGLYISSRLRNYWENFDIREGIRWLAEFLQRPESKEFPHARAKALFAQGWFLQWVQQFDEARAVAEECLSLFRAYGNQSDKAAGLLLLGFVVGPIKNEEIIQQAFALAKSLGDLSLQGAAAAVLGWDNRDSKRAFAYREQAVALFRQAGDWRNLAINLSELGFFRLLHGDLESAQKHLDESSSLFQKLNIKVRKGHLLTAHGQIALLRGDYEQAYDYYQENVRIAQESGSWMDYLWAKVRLGYVEMQKGNLADAHEIFIETILNFQKDGNQIGVVFALEGMASLYIAAGKNHHAARLIGWTDGMRAAIGNTRPLLEQADIDRDVAASVSRIGKAVFNKAYNKGWDMTFDEAVAYALDG